MILRTFGRKCSILNRRFVTAARISNRVVHFSTTNEENDRPIAYTKSKAFKYKALENFRSEENSESTVPSYNGLVIQASVVAFMVWFFILREPNDIDDLLGRDLFEIMPDLEIPMLEADIKRLESHGVNVDEMRRKLTELKRLDDEKKRNQANIATNS